MKRIIIGIILLMVLSVTFLSVMGFDSFTVDRVLFSVYYLIACVLSGYRIFNIEARKLRDWIVLTTAYSSGVYVCWAYLSRTLNFVTEGMLPIYELLLAYILGLVTSYAVKKILKEKHFRRGRLS